MREVGLEKVRVRVQFDEVAVGKDSHGGDDTQNDFTDGCLDQREVGYVGSSGEVEFELGRVDKCHLGGPNLESMVNIPCEQNVVL